MEKNILVKKAVLLLVLVSLFCSCQTEEAFVPTESVKDLSGSWRIIHATQNKADITQTVDFTSFRLNFLSDSTYTIENPLPFIVSKNGSWSLDNPSYPFKITFTGTGGATPATTDFVYPVVNGKRNIILKFSPGCINNTYQYTLEKVNP